MCIASTRIVLSLHRAIRGFDADEPDGIDGVPGAVTRRFGDIAHAGQAEEADRCVSQRGHDSWAVVLSHP
jgi:hypothetical protein